MILYLLSEILLINLTIIIFQKRIFAAFAGIISQRTFSSLADINVSVKIVFRFTKKARTQNFVQDAAKG